MRCEK